VIGRRALLLALAIGCAPATQPAVDDAGADVGTDAAVLEPRFADCARCHATAARDHASTMHARAFDDPLFQREWSARRLSWCVDCHAPLADDADDPRVHEGVGCASCHVEDGAITSRTASGRAPHRTVAIDGFDDAERCGRCHEFDFMERRRRRPERMQRTLSEWQRSGRSETCVDCHMPEGSHRLVGARDPALLERSLDVEVAAERRGRSIVVRASLRVAGAAHAVPTGDLFRNLVFRATASGATAEADAARVFDRDEDGARIEIADQRVLPGIERRIELVLRPRTGAARVDWSLTWNALPPDAADVDGIDESFRTRVIASGHVRPR